MLRKLLPLVLLASAVVTRLPTEKAAFGSVPLATLR